MALKKRSETVNLKVQKDEKVLLTITIGNAQIGGNFIKFKNSSDVLAKGEVQNLDLGTGSGLIGKTLKITTNILDANDQTNGVVVTYFFHSCTPPVTVFNDSVDNDGDVFSFLVEFNFQ
jgi:hypothetical protein